MTPGASAAAIGFPAAPAIGQTRIDSGVPWACAGSFVELIWLRRAMAHWSLRASVSFGGQEIATVAIQRGNVVATVGAADGRDLPYSASNASNCLS